MSENRTALLPRILLAVLVGCLVAALSAGRADAEADRDGTADGIAAEMAGLRDVEAAIGTTEADETTGADGAEGNEGSPALTGTDEPKTEPSANFPAAAAIVADGLPAVHLLRFPFDASRSAMAWTNYLGSLDIERMYFTQEDLARLEPHRLRLREEMIAGDLSFAEEAHDLFMERMRARMAAVQKALAEDEFDFTTDEEYMWRRRDAAWPADAEECDDLWRRRLKNEVLARLVMKTLDEEEAEAKKETEAKEEAEAKEEDEAKEENEPEEVPEETPQEYLAKRYAKLLSFWEDADSETYLSRFVTAACMAYDPHSDYFSPVSQEDFDINMQLSLQGIGATLQTEDGTAKITEIIPGGPADRDTRDIRLVPGDRIIAVAQGDGEFVDILHWPLYKAVRLIRGKKGSKVRLLVQRADDPSHVKTKVVELVRDEVKLEEQAATSNVETFTDAEGRERKMGVVTLPTFYAGGGRDGATQRSCSADIARLLVDLNAQGVEGLVLDLRGNGGGALKEAVDLVGLFIRTGPVVLVREHRGTTALKDFNPAVAFTKPMVVLVDRLSASASEIVAGALQDYGRAPIVGDTHTHGKGTVQQIMALNGERLGSLKVTNAGFYRITGDSTQLRGVSSDIVLSSVFDFYSELGEDKLPNAIPWSHVRGASFRPAGDLSAVLPELREKSETRRASDERWQRHVRRLQVVERVNRMTSVPLEMERRLTLAREERAMLDDEDEALGARTTAGASPLPEDGEEGRTKTRAERAAERRAKDVVLDEGLRILADLVDAEERRDGDEEGQASPRSIDKIPDLFRNFF